MLRYGDLSSLCSRPHLFVATSTSSQLPARHLHQIWIVAVGECKRVCACLHGRALAKPLEDERFGMGVRTSIFLPLGGSLAIAVAVAFSQCRGDEIWGVLWVSRRTDPWPKLNSQTADQKSESEQEGHTPSVHDALQLDKWCIYRVPSKLRKVNEAAYTPQLLSIGPFHHGKPELKNMEERKKVYCLNFCKRCSKSEDDLKNFIKPLKDSILGCYAETIELANKIDPYIELANKIDPIDVFVEVILVDACFIIELFLVNSETENDENDYILRRPWLRKAIEQDLMLFENQLPYSLLQGLYDFAKPSKKQVQGQVHRQRSTNHDEQQSCCLPSFQHCFPCSRCQAGRHSSTDRERSQDHSIHIFKDKTEAVQDHDPFLKLTCDFFKDYSKGKSVKNGPIHFTDLVRYFLCPDKKDTSDEPEGPEGKMKCKVKLDICCKTAMCKDTSNTPIKNIYVVKQLRAAGVKFRPLNNEDLAASPKKKTRSCSFAKKKEEDLYARFFIKVDDAHKLTLACFRNMYLKLTQFCVKDETECIMRNVIALEQFLYPNEAYICNYFLLLDELVDNVEDVSFLVESKVIINMLGSNKAVAKLINSLCENIMEDQSCYGHVCKQLNEHYENFWNRHVATLRQVYFKDLWTGSATILGFVVLVVSLTVSIRTIISGRKLCIQK